jgi:glutathione-independent formaldehyde dehydrogenase
MGTGQADAKQYAHQLRDMIVAGRATPSFVVSQHLPLSGAPDAYARFDKREEGYSKVLLQPGKAA